MVLKSIENLLLIIYILSISACSEKNQEFINSSFSNNQNFYFSFGEGKSEKESITNALERIASSLSSEVSSLFLLHKESTELGYNKKSEHDIRVEVKKISFSYTIVSQEKRDKNYFIKLKIDRQKTATLYAHKLKRELAQIDSELEQLSTLKQYLFLKKYPFEKLYYKLDIISSVNPNDANIKKFSEGIKALENKKYKQRKALSFNITSKSSQFKDIVIEILNGEKFNIASNGDIELIVKMGEIKIDEIYGEYYGVSSVTIEIVKKEEMISKIISLSAKPSFSKKGVREKLIQDFKKKFYLFVKKEFQ